MHFTQVKETFSLAFPFYWLIVVLSYLGKALKRIVARNLSNMALKNKLFSAFYFYATLRRLAVNVVATLTHNIKTASFDKEIMSVLAFDIKGTFDRITNRRLIKRL